MNRGSERPILVVDDDDDARATLCETLEADGYEVLEAAHGKAALDILVSEGASEPCLIVLDLQMPVMSGWEFVAIIKSYHRLSSIPVVIVSGTAPHPETVARGTIAAWLQKPCEATELVALVEAHARKHCGVTLVAASS